MPKAGMDDLEELPLSAYPDHPSPVDGNSTYGHHIFLLEQRLKGLAVIVRVPESATGIGYIEFFRLVRVHCEICNPCRS